ncbi:MAG: hypothetical protein WBB42_05750 [Polyangiales bacterium]
MISFRQTAWNWTCCATLIAVTACGESQGAVDSENAVIDPPAQCSAGRPDCWISQDFPVAGDLNEDNSAGVRYSVGTRSLVIDRVTALPDDDGDGVPNDADDCPGTPDWISCDDDPSNDGLYQTVFFDSTGADEVVRSSTVDVVADIPEVDIYFLIDATPMLVEEITVLQAEILNIISDVRLSFPNAQFGLGLYREYPLAPLAAAHSQAPYHHILDFTDDDVLVQTAVSTLNTVQNATSASAATQALYSVASGLGLGDMVPNRGACPNAPDADIGYPCFRDGALHVVMNITDAEVHNGPNPTGVEYGDPPFAPGVGLGGTTLPPVEMFPELFAADTAALALDLGDLSGRSLTLMGMSTLLTNQVNTAVSLGCDTMSGMPPGADMDGKDVVLALRFDSLVLDADVFANNTHWPGANVALFEDALLDPATAVTCDGGTVGVGNWGAINWAPATSQQYYLVADGIIPAADPGLMPEGAFSISIVHSGDPANNPAWLTSDAPVAWTDVVAALLLSKIRVASVVTLRDAMSMTSDGAADAREIALATDARTRFGSPWLTELSSSTGEGLDAAISNTITLARSLSVYDISMVELDNAATGVDERDFIAQIRHDNCAEGQAVNCSFGTLNECRSCELGAALKYEVIFANRTVSPTGASQVFDFELVVWADDSVEVERIPVRVMVPDSASHVFDDTPASAFYRNVYDSTTRCITPPEHPKWGLLTWEGTTPFDSSIEFQIRTAPAIEDLPTAIPVIISITGDDESGTFDIREELIAAGQTFGLPYIQITAVLNSSNSPQATPTLEGWTFEFVCEAAQ